MASQDRGPAVHRIFISGFFKRLRSLVYRKTQKEKKYIFEANNYKIKEKKKLGLHSFLIICVLNMFIWNDFKEQRFRGF